jgi:opacity protein-like surface antigen
MTRWLTLALLLFPAAAHADVFAVPFMGVKFGGGTSIFDLEFAADKTKFTMGGSIMNLGRIVGYEGTFGYVPGYFEYGNETLVASGSFVIDLTGNVLVALPPGATGGGLRPYVAAGVGLAHAQATDSLLSVLQVRRTMPAFTVGGGAIGLFSNSVGVRFDYRFLRSLTSDDGSLAQVGRRISYHRFAVGLLLRL